MARIEPIDPTAVPDDVREALENLPPLNIFRMLAATEETLRAFSRFGQHIAFRTSLDPVLREIAILRTGQRTEASRGTA